MEGEEIVLMGQMEEYISRKKKITGNIWKTMRFSLQILSADLSLKQKYE